MAIEVDLGDSVGRALAAQGLYDVVTTDILWRLTSAGDLAVDCGANVGYMSSILAYRAGPFGKVTAFEPYAPTFEILQRNVNTWNSAKRHARIETYRLAVSDFRGTAWLKYYGGNVSGCELHTEGVSNITVEVVRLEEFIKGKPIGVLKLDIEGHEARALHGIGDLSLIRDIIFEEHRPYPAETHSILEKAGFTIFGAEERLSGPKLIPPAQKARRRVYDVPGYVATQDPRRAESLLSKYGWSSF